MLPDTYDKDSFDGIPLTVLEHFDWEDEPTEATERPLASDAEEGLCGVSLRCVRVLLRVSVSVLTHLNKTRS